MISKILLFSILFMVGIKSYGQQNFNVAVFADSEYFDNYGDIDTDEKITDGYSPIGQLKGYGIELEYRTYGASLKKLELELNGDGFENPFRIIEAQYDDFPRPWSSKGGSYHIYGYLFDGYSIGLFKIFKLNHFDLRISGDYGKIDVKINPRHPSNQLFSYSYNTEKNFSSRHWAYYDGGDFYSIQLEAIRNIWKGFQIYAGLGHRNGSFDYTFREEVLDTKIPANNRVDRTDISKGFKSIGFKFGVKYTQNIY